MRHSESDVEGLYNSVSLLCRQTERSEGEGAFSGPGDVVSGRQLRLFGSGRRGIVVVTWLRLLNPRMNEVFVWRMVYS